MKKQLRNTVVILAAALLSISVNAEPKVKVGGMLEFQLTSTSNKDFDKTTDAKKSQSDMALSTAQLNFDADINETLKGFVSLEFEDAGGNPATHAANTTTGAGNFLNVEQAYLQRKLLDGALTMTLGRVVAPVATFKSNMVSEPLTQWMGEAHEDALMAAYNVSDFNFGVYAFNGETMGSTDKSEKINDFGVFVNHSFKGDAFGIDTHIGFITDITDADMLQAVFGSTLPKDEVSGTAISLAMTFDMFNLYLEHVMAGKLKDFGATYQVEGKDVAPSATNIEFGYTMDQWIFALGQQMTSNARKLATIPESKTLLTVSYKMDSECLVSLEYYTAKDYKTAKGGTNGSSTNGDESQVTVQWQSMF